MSDDELFRMKGEVAGVASGEVRVSKRAVDVIGALFPGVALKRSAREVVAQLIINRIRNGEPLDDAELEYAEARLGEDVAKFARRKAVAARAVRALDSGIVRALPPAGDGAAGEEDRSQKPGEDWLNRFWADAELISDETVQEIYGRILASEAVKPGACSKRTLAVLRGLDRETAERFAKCLGIVLGDFIPNDTKLVEAAGLEYYEILDLDDAGLLDSRGSLSKLIDRDLGFFQCGSRIVEVRGANGVQLRAHPLTRAGRELSSIADVQHKVDHFNQLLRWIKRSAPKATIRWATLPAKDWEGDSEDLEWRELTPDENPQPQD